jgi:hypothetical protein
MSAPTLIFVRHHSIGGRLFRHGTELEPDTLSAEQIDRLLDEHILSDRTQRRSLYRLLHNFSGCKESQPLTNEERNNLCL